MAKDLNLKVTLAAIDKATGPFKNIGRGAGSLGEQFKKTRENLKGLQAQQKDISSFREVKDSLVQNGAAMVANRDRLQALSREMASTATPSKALTREFQSATRQGEALKQKHNEQLRTLQGLHGKLGQAGISTRNLATHEADLKRKISQTTDTMGKQEQQLKRLADKQRALAKARASYDKSRELQGNIASGGAKAAAVGGGMIYGGVRFLEEGATFDATMSKVQALARLDKESVEMAQLRAQARQLGASTSFSANDVAEGQSFLAMGGFDPKAIQDAMPGLLSMAKAGATDLAATSDIASNILGGFGLEASQMTRVADVLTKAFTTSNTSLGMLGETMKYVGPVARASGMGLEDAAAMAGLLGNVGIQSSQAGTTLRAMLLRLAAPAGPAAKAMKKLGVASKDAAGNVRPITTILGEVAKATEKMGTGDQLKYLKDIFGEEPAAGMSELLKQSGSGGILKYLDVVRDSQGAALKTAATIGDNLKGDIDGLSSAWADVQIGIFEGQNVGLRGLTADLTDAVRWVGKFTQDHPGFTSALVKGAGALAAAAVAGGTLALTIAGLIGPLAAAKFAMATFGITTGLALKPLLLIGGGVALLAGAAYLIYRNWEPIKTFFLGMWSGIKTGALGMWDEIKLGFSGGFAGIAATIVNFSPLGLFYKAFAGVLSYLGVDLPGRFTEFGGMLMQGLANGIKNMAGAVKGAVVGAADSSIGWFKEKLGIHSPSRVFAELGGFTMAGLAQGLAGGEDGPLKQITGTVKRLTAAGVVGLSAATGAFPAAAGEPISIDTRPPLATSSAASAARGGDVFNVSVTVQVQGGGDPNAIAAAVRREFESIQREAAARRRSSLNDLE